MDWVSASAEGKKPLRLVATYLADAAQQREALRAFTMEASGARDISDRLHATHDSEDEAQVDATFAVLSEWVSGIEAVDFGVEESTNVADQDGRTLKTPSDGAND